LEDYLILFENGRRPQYFGNGKTISIFWKLEDDFNLQKIEYDLNIFSKGRLPLYFSQWKTTTIFWKMEEDLKYLEYGIT
jgi:hypothetical protein